jgi:hypothetical protein
MLIIIIRTLFLIAGVLNLGHINGVWTGVLGVTCIFCYVMVGHLTYEPFPPLPTSKEENKDGELLP